MNKNGQEIPSIVSSLLNSNNPELQKQTVEQYFTPNAEFSHDLFHVPSGPHSRQRIVGIYQYWRAINPTLTAKVVEYSVNQQGTRAFIEVKQQIKPFGLWWASTIHVWAVLDLYREGDRYLISRQRDYIMPEDIAGAVFLGGWTFIRLIKVLNAYGLATLGAVVGATKKMLLSSTNEA